MILQALVAVIIVSLISLIGGVFLILKRTLINRLMSPLLAFSSGVLLGSTFFDLVPESIHLVPENAFILIVTGIILFFSLEKLLKWHHHVEGDHLEEEKVVGYLSIVGDGIHNFIDGVMMGAAFLVSLPLGITVTLAVIAHEVPHELADFTILLHSGFSNAKALWYNFLSATTAILGTLLVFWLSTYSQSVVSILVPIGAGNLLYIAMSDLIPELHRPRSRAASIIQIIMLILGAAAIHALPAD